MDARSHQLADRVAADMPAWAGELGRRPEETEVTGVAEWRRRAGIVAGYQEAFGLEAVSTLTGGEVELGDPIGPAPPPGRADARLWWQRAAQALGRTAPTTLAERLEAIVDQARHTQTVAPPAVDAELRAVSAHLREAQTAHGHAVAGGRPPSPERAAQLQVLTATVAELETSHCHREQWWAATRGLHAQADAAAAELAARHEARATCPHWDMNLDTLRAELTRTERQLRTATWVTARHDRVSHQWQHTVDTLAGELARLTADHPEVSIAEDLIAGEREVAAKIDELQATVARRRLLPTMLRAGVRGDLTAELNNLLNTYPQLRSSPAAREERWSTILDRAEATEQRRLTEIGGRLDHTMAKVDEHAGIANAARSDIDQLKAGVDRAGLTASDSNAPSSSCASATLLARSNVYCSSELSFRYR